MDCHPIVTTQFQQLDTELKGAKRRNVALTDSFDDYKLVFKNTEKKLEEYQSKDLAPMRDFNQTEQKWKVMGAEKDMLLNSPSKFISNASAESMPGGGTLTDRLVQYFQAQFVGPPMKEPR